jgi:hypothetical protein
MLDFQVKFLVMVLLTVTLEIYGFMVVLFGVMLVVLEVRREFRVFKV